MDTFNKVLKWFVQSSANPEEMSLTFQGTALLVGSKAFDMLSNVGLGFDFQIYTHDVAIASAVIGVAAAVYGGIRKIVLTVHNAQASTDIIG